HHFVGAAHRIADKRDFLLGVAVDEGRGQLEKAAVTLEKVVFVQRKLLAAVGFLADAGRGLLLRIESAGALRIDRKLLLHPRDGLAQVRKEDAIGEMDRKA